MRFRNCTLMVTGALLLAVVASLVARADDASEAKAEARRIRYARAYVALTRLDLQVAIDRNKANPNTLPRSLILLLEQQVAVAEQLQRKAESESAGQPYDFAVEIAKIYAETAATNYARGLEINGITPMAPQDLERLRLKSELAQMSLEWAKEIDPASPLALLQFHVVRLGENVAELTRNQMEILDRN